MSMEYPVTSAKTKLLKATKVAFGKAQKQIQLSRKRGQKHMAGFDEN